jgi:glycosyltransferase involved in cell wall biosynthesis
MPGTNRRIAFVGDYVPRRCGIATFTHDLCEAVAAVSPASECMVGAVNDRPEGYDYSNRVRFELVEKDIDSYRRAADFLNFNNVEVLCVQHEFGIYGGQAGSHLLALLKEVRMPVVTTLHTVLREPNARQRQVMNDIARRSDRLIVMAHKGADFLREIYQVSGEKIDVIAHGIPDVPFRDAGFYKEQFGVEGKKVLFTFGLLGPAKGIEYVIEALPEIIRQYPDVVYLILGATHPNLLDTDGESYRLSLERLAEDRGVKKHVIFYNRFVSAEDLREFIGAADIYITPYLSEAQITSGTLAYVFGAGKAVVSTPYWHAQELLADGRGILVPFRDPLAIAGAVVAYLDSPAHFEETRRNAYDMGRGMIWPAVAKLYLDVFAHAQQDRREAPRRAFADWTLESRLPDLPPVRLDHVVRMTDRTGMFQHAVFNVPNFSEGYCTDDNARAYILCNLIDETGGELPSKSLDKLATTYLAFLWHALPAGAHRFRNFMDHNRNWHNGPGSEDSHARALWAAGTGVGRSRNDGHRNLCGAILQRALPVAATFASPRAWAFTLLAIDEYLRRFSGDSAMNAMRGLLTQKLVCAWENTTDNDWQWFEPAVTYDNARISQALILSGRWMRDKEVLDIGLASLAWLATIQTADSGHFSPVGSNGFFKRGGPRAVFDQQPLEANAMVAACLEAFRATKDVWWFTQAHRVFEWFLGRNDLGISLYDPRTGGCRDGLHPDRANENQGAESTLAFHLSLAEMNSAEHVIANAGI